MHGLSLDGWTLHAETRDAAPGGGDVTIRHPETVMIWRRTFDQPIGPSWCWIEIAYPESGVVDAALRLTLADGTCREQHFTKRARNRFLLLFRPALPMLRIDIVVSGSAPLEAPSCLAMRSVSDWERRWLLLRRGAHVLRHEPASFAWRALRFLVELRRQRRTTIPMVEQDLSNEDAYALWRVRFDEDDTDIAFHLDRASRIGARRMFSIIVDPEADAAETDVLLASLKAQTYERWELIGADAVPEAPPAGTRAAQIDARLARARGDFVFLPCPGTVFRPHALFVFAATLDRSSGAQLVYADDDDLGPTGRSNPRFKPAWSPERALGWNYLGDPCCFEAGRLRAVGASREGEAPAQRHDLLLRFSAGLAAGAVVHVAQVLSHATRPAGAASTARDRPARPLRSPAAPIQVDPRSIHPRFIHAAADPAPLVSLIIPTRDCAALLRTSVGTIRARTTYRPFEIIVVDNGSCDPETLALFESWAGDDTIQILRDDSPFNYAALNNRAASAARGTVLGLVNNDIEVLDGGWLDEMVGWVMRPGVGCVGAKLYYPDRRLQHGGVVTGVGGAAGHLHRRAHRQEAGWLDSLLTVNNVSAVTAACLVVRKAVFDEVGGLDEETFAVAYNDVDFCLRVAAAGYRNLWTPFAELIHHETLSRAHDLSPSQSERYDREMLNLKLRWGNRLLDDPYYSPNLTLETENCAIRTQ